MLMKIKNFLHQKFKNQNIKIKKIMNYIYYNKV